MSTLSVEQILTLLKNAEIDLEGEFVHGYNYTFLVKVQPGDGESFLAVYKPQQNQRQSSAPQVEDRQAAEPELPD